MPRRFLPQTVLFGWLLIAITGTSLARTVTVGVVRDDASVTDSLSVLAETELQPVLATGTQVEFRRGGELDGDWTLEGIRRALVGALDDPTIDYVLVTGALGTYIASQLDLEKPVLSGFPQRTDWFDIVDVEGDSSTRPGLSVIVLPHRAEGDITAFARIAEIDTAYVALQEAYTSFLPLVANEVRALEEATGVVLHTLPVGRDVRGAVAGLPTTARFVILADLAGLDENDRQSLILELNRRRVFVFSFEDHEDVELGALAARMPDISQSVARRIALNINELIRGRSQGTLPALLSLDPVLLVNGRTAVDVGYSPSPEILAFEKFLYPDALASDETSLSFAEGLRLAEENNISISISSQEVEVARREKQLAGSPLWPQINFNPRYLWSRPAGLEGIIPEGIFSVGGTITQIIYDDRTISNLRSAKRLYGQSQENLEAERLDVLANAGTAFTELLLARILRRVQREYLLVTEENLELAKFRLDVGYSGRDEVYRWEAERANRQAQLFDTSALIESQRIALNQILGLQQDRRWSPVEPHPETGIFPFLNGGLRDVFGHVGEIELFREFSVLLAHENAPELRGLALGVEAQEIQVSQRKRRWWLPSFEAAFRYDYHVYRDPQLPDIGDDFPRVAVQMNYPIFEGAARAYEVGREGSELVRLREERRLTGDLVERRVRTAFRRIEASFPSIRLTEIAAEAARKNLDLVQDKYAQGLVNVTDLLQAQTESFANAQNQVAALYIFFFDLIAFQRSIGWFEAEKTPEEQQELLERIRIALAVGKAPASTGTGGPDDE